MQLRTRETVKFQYFCHRSIFSIYSGIISFAPFSTVIAALGSRKKCESDACLDAKNG